MNRNGGLAELCVVDSTTVHAFPRSLPFQEAAFAEPLACVLNGVQRSGFAAGDSVAIVGLGPIGQLFARVFESMGARTVVGFEVNPERAEFARKLGVTAVIDPTKDGWQDDAQVRTGGLGFGAVVDAVATSVASKIAVEVVRRGGTVVIFGIPPHGAKLELETERLVKSEISVTGSFIDRFTFPRAIAMLSDRTVDVRPLLTEIFALADAKDAFEAVKKSRGLKVQVLPF
jgi:threonine dehydrogenase-like Zn-dependent dehydrogenase